MQWIADSFIDAAPYFKKVTPGPMSLLKLPRFLKACVKMYNEIKNHTNKTSKQRRYDFVKGLVLDPLKSKVMSGHKTVTRRTIDRTRKNGLGGRKWFYPDELNGKRLIKDIVIMYHEASHKHIDIHIGHLSIVIRVSGKEVENKIKFDKEGVLTNDSKEALMDHIRTEISGNSRVVHNLDHTIGSANSCWYSHDIGPRGYGEGRTRQQVFRGKAEVLSVDEGPGGTLKLFIPGLYKNSIVYVHKLYTPIKDKRSAPILIMGKISKPNITHNNSISLRRAPDRGSFLSKVDPKTITLKEDGASTFFRIDSKGMRLFSPRIGKDGDPIEYTHKVPELMRVKCSDNVAGVGELLFYKKFIPWKPDTWLMKDLSAAQIGGVLNKQDIRDPGLLVRLVVYRVDKWGKDKIIDLPYQDNRLFQMRVAALDGHGNIQIPMPVFYVDSLDNSIEGYVGVAPGGNINNAYKFKMWGDPQDWEVIGNSFTLNDNGNIQGVINFRYNGKEYNMGPGSIGSKEFCKSLISQGDGIIGKVAKVKGRVGHDGRAAQFIEWHNDKGI